MEAMSVKNRDSSVEYKDILPYIDLQYIAKPKEIKENIILKSAQAQNAITFTYDFGKYEAKLN